MKQDESETANDVDRCMQMVVFLNVINPKDIEVAHPKGYEMNRLRQRIFDRRRYD